MSSLAFILMLVLFMTVDASQFPRLPHCRPRGPSQWSDALETFAPRTRSYLIVSTVFGLIVAVLDTLALCALGVPPPSCGDCWPS